MSENRINKTFLQCSVCNKRLIERLPNGLFRFIFGGGKKRSGGSLPPPVDMQIHGSVKMKCIRKTCRAVNVFNYFPHTKHFPELQSGLTESNESDIDKD